MASAVDGFYHTPVLLDRIIEVLKPRSEGIYLDCTLGGGGHAEAILAAGAPNARLWGLDRDQDALNAASARLSKFAERFNCVKGNFAEADKLLKENNFDGILLDLGISSYQIDTPLRGFSIDRNGPLDMRMDSASGETAAEMIIRLEQKELAGILKKYGEEPFAGKIAAAIKRRESDGKPLDTTSQLAELVRGSVPFKQERKSLSRVFQALRIAVNHELDSLSAALDKLVGILTHGGRLAVISYHSLEDRMVKRFFANLADPCICPPDFPQCACGRQAEVKLVTRKPIMADEDETANNPRSRSARLRVVEKL